MRHPRWAVRDIRHRRDDVLRLPDGSGLDLLEALVAADPDRPVIIMTAYGSVADAVGAMQRGARDYVQKPLDLEEVRLKIEHALHSARQRREISYYRGREASAAAILGESPSAQRLRTLVTRIARMTTGPGAPAPTVLLLGAVWQPVGVACREGDAPSQIHPSHRYSIPGG